MKKIRNQLENIWVFFALAGYFILCVNSLRIFSFIIPSVFQARDLDRASLLTHGQFIFFGPEVTGGGNLPGPFYYVLLAIPKLLGIADIYGVVGFAAIG